jgi:hypothetical protein
MIRAGDLCRSGEEMSAKGVHRDRAALSSGWEAHPANALAGSAQTKRGPLNVEVHIARRSSRRSIAISANAAHGSTSLPGDATIVFEALSDSPLPMSCEPPATTFGPSIRRRASASWQARSPSGLPCPAAAPKRRRLRAAVSPWRSRGHMPGILRVPLYRFDL